MNAKHDSLDATERRQAARLLLRMPLVTAASHPGDFHLIRKHADELRRDFARILGYRLVVEGRFARLHKAGLGRDSGRRLVRTTTGTEFAPRTYTYLVLALAALVTAPEQLLLSELLRRIHDAAADADLDLGELTRTQKRHLGAALKQLITWQVISEAEGTVELWYSDESEREALLNIDTEIARRLVTGPIGAAATAEDLIDRAEAPERGEARISVRRRLIETPVVYLDDLCDEERAWLRGNQRREQETLHRWLGMDLEVRAEGAALLDESDESSDVAFPATGTVPQAALLLIDRLVADFGPVSAGHPATGGTLVIGSPVPVERIDAVLAELAEKHTKAWAQAYVSDIPRLRTETLKLLGDMRLMAPAGPTRADAARTAPPQDAEHNLPTDRQVTDVSGARGQPADDIAQAHDPETWVLLGAAARYRSPEVTLRRRASEEEDA